MYTQDFSRDGQPDYREREQRRGQKLTCGPDAVEEPMYGRQCAQGLVEYALIIALVAVLAIAGLMLFGPAINDLLSSVSGSI